MENNINRFLDDDFRVIRPTKKMDEKFHFAESAAQKTDCKYGSIIESYQAMHNWVEQIHFFITLLKKIKDKKDIFAISMAWESVKNDIKCYPLVKDSISIKRNKLLSSQL